MAMPAICSRQFGEERIVFGKEKLPASFFAGSQLSLPCQKLIVFTIVRNDGMHELFQRQGYPFRRDGVCTECPDKLIYIVLVNGKFSHNIVQGLVHFQWILYGHKRLLSQQMRSAITEEFVGMP